MSTFTLYLLLTLPSLSSSIATFGWLSAFVLGIMAGFHYFNEVRDDEVNARLEKRGVSLFKWGIFCVVFATLIGGLVPDKEVIYAVAAWEVGSNIDGLSEVPAQLTEFIQTYLNNEITELQAATAEE